MLTRASPSGAPEFQRKMSDRPLVSAFTRFVASEAKTSVAPSPLSAGSRLGPFAGTPPTPRLTSAIVFAPLVNR